MILYQTVLWFAGLRWRVSTLIFTLSGLNFMKSQTMVQPCTIRIVHAPFEWCNHAQWFNHAPGWTNWLATFDQLPILQDERSFSQLTDILDLAKRSAHFLINYCMPQILSVALFQSCLICYFWDELLRWTANLARRNVCCSIDRYIWSCQAKHPFVDQLLHATTCLWHYLAFKWNLQVLPFSLEGK